MKTAILFSLCAVLFSADIGFAEDIPVQSRNGKTLTLKDIRGGYFQTVSPRKRKKIGADSAGNPIFKSDAQSYNFFRTDSIPLRIGDLFGFQFILPPMEEGDFIELEGIMQFPAAVTVAGRSLSSTQWKTRYAPQQGRVINAWEFREATPAYHLKGRWIFSLYNRGRLVVSQPFFVK